MSDPMPMVWAEGDPLDGGGLSNGVPLPNGVGREGVIRLRVKRSIEGSSATFTPAPVPTHATPNAPGGRDGEARDDHPPIACPGGSVGPGGGAHEACLAAATAPGSWTTPRCAAPMGRDSVRQPHPPHVNGGPRTPDASTASTANTGTVPVLDHNAEQCPSGTYAFALPTLIGLPPPPPGVKLSLAINIPFHDQG